jgi:hypothetical protein
MKFPKTTRERFPAAFIQTKAKKRHLMKFPKTTPERFPAAFQTWEVGGDVIRWLRPERLSVCRRESDDADCDFLNRIVAVAEPVPFGMFGLNSARTVRCTRAQ